MSTLITIPHDFKVYEVFAYYNKGTNQVLLETSRILAFAYVDEGNASPHLRPIPLRISYSDATDSNIGLRGVLDTEYGIVKASTGERFSSLDAFKAKVKALALAA
jgi:hypothetical protein